MVWQLVLIRQVDAIQERHSLVETFVNNAEVRQTLHEDHLRKMPDFQRISAKFHTKAAKLQVGEERSNQHQLI